MKKKETKEQIEKRMDRERKARIKWGASKSKRIYVKEKNKATNKISLLKKEKKKKDKIKEKKKKDKIKEKKNTLKAREDIHKTIGRLYKEYKDLSFVRKADKKKYNDIAVVLRRYVRKYGIEMCNKYCFIRGNLICYCGDKISRGITCDYCKGLTLNYIRTRGGRVDNKYRKEFKKHFGLVTSCQWCGSKDFLEIHHINKNRKDNTKKNLCKICLDCHCKAHVGDSVYPLMKSKLKTYTANNM